MTDERWLDVEADLSEALRHFAKAVSIADKVARPGDDDALYWIRMGFMHAMQSGYTSFENGLLRVLDIMGEVAPTGASWHADLLARACREIPGKRPPILSSDVCLAAHETRHFRHVALRAYARFEPDRVGPVVGAARILLERLGGELTAFRAAIEGGTWV